MGKHKHRHCKDHKDHIEKPKCRSSDNSKHHHGHYSTQKQYCQTNKGYELRQYPYDRCAQSSAYAMFNPFYGIECYNYQLSPFVHIPGQYRLPMLTPDSSACRRC